MERIKNEVIWEQSELKNNIIDEIKERKKKTCMAM